MDRSKTYFYCKWLSAHDEVRRSNENIVQLYEMVNHLQEISNTFKEKDSVENGQLLMAVGNIRHALLVMQNKSEDSQIKLQKISFALSILRSKERALLRA